MQAGKLEQVRDTLGNATQANTALAAENVMRIGTQIAKEMTSEP